ncbi:MAG: GumC family protein [Reyranellaceae bacterium]
MSNIARFNPQLPDAPSENGAIGTGEREGLLRLRQVYGVLRRHYILIAVITIVGTALASLWASTLTPIYRSSTQVLIDPNRDTVTKITPVAPGLGQEYTMMETQAAIIRSRELAVQAVRRLDLINHPLYNPALAKPQPSLWQRLLAPLTALFTDAPAVEESRSVAIAPQTPEERARLLEGIIGAYLGGLSVAPATTGARWVTISFTSPDPKLAADAANMAAEVYIKGQVSNRGESTQSALRFLSEKVEELRGKMIEAERALTQFRTDTGLLQVGETSPVAQQLTSYRGQLIEARATIRNLESSGTQLRDMLRGQGSIEANSQVMTNPFIAQLRSQQADIERKIAEARTQLRDNHPQLIAMRNELREVQGKIGSEIRKVSANLGNELAVMKQREESLNVEIKRLEGELSKQANHEVQLTELRTSAQSARQLYEATLARFNEVSITDDNVLQKAEARVLQPAFMPGGPIAPQRNAIMFMAFLISLAVGVALAVVIELLDAGFRSVHQLEQMAGAPALGMVPFQASKMGRNKRPWDTVLDKPNSSFAEAIRTIRTGLLLSSVDHPPRTVLVTSSVPGEGKTTTALALASAAAASGQRTIIVDCDMRQPALHANLGTKNELGLSDYLTGNAALEDLIHIDDRSGLHYICAGRLPPSPTDLLGSNRMKQLLQQLSAAFQMVMLDTPPILAVSDALLLVRTVDKTIFVVRWERTRRDIALNGLKSVYDAGARVGGLVLSQVNLRKHARYDYTDSGVYYYRGYKRYYIE